MNTQELQSIIGEHNNIQRWKEKYLTECLSHSLEFKRYYQAVKHQQHIMELLSDSLSIPPLTIEEKVANAFFYVDSNGRYEITSYDLDGKYFFFVDPANNDVEYNLNFHEIPADAYFLGVTKL